jgi:hypothetical protein
MTVKTIFAAIQYFFTEVLFLPFNFVRSMDNWWIQNIVSFTFISIALVALVYWLNQLMIFKKEENS